VIDLWSNSNNWYQSKVKDLKLRLPEEVTLLTPRGGRSSVGGDGEYAGVRKTTGDRARRSNTEGRQGVVIVKVMEVDDR
jgi:hypothetical protein